MSELPKLSFLLKTIKHGVPLTRFLQDVAAGRDSVDRYCTVMTHLEKVHLRSVWLTLCDLV